jgi:hypothetical protein
MPKPKPPYNIRQNMLAFKLEHKHASTVMHVDTSL